MEPSAWSMLYRLVLYIIQFYFVYLPFSVVLYGPQNTYIVITDSPHKLSEKYLDDLRKFNAAGQTQNNNTEDFIVKVVEPNGKTGFDNVIKHIQELFAATKDGIPDSNGKQAGKDGKGKAANEKKKKKLTFDFVYKSLATVTEIMNKFVQNDPNAERSAKANKTVIDALSCYAKLLDQANKKKAKDGSDGSKVKNKNQKKGNLVRLD